MNRFEIPERFDFLKVDNETVKTAGIYAGAAVGIAATCYGIYKLVEYFGAASGVGGVKNVFKSNDSDNSNNDNSDKA